MKTKTPKEDPRIKSAREAEERRANSAFLENTSQLLDEETRRRIRKFGNRATAARAATPVRPGGGMGGQGGGGAGGTGGEGSFDPGRGLVGRTEGGSFGGGGRI